MDLNTVTWVAPALSRADLAGLSDRVVPLAGGSVLFADPDADLDGLIDLTALGWPATEVTVAGLDVSATCTLAELSRLDPRPGWNAHPLFFQCCTALFGSFKIWNVATVGGNLCTSLPAGPMTSLGASLDADALIWRADGTDELIPVARFVTGNPTNVLRTGDVLRLIRIPVWSLRAETAYRKIALSPLGRSGSVVIGRVDPGGQFVLTVTAATTHPEQLRYAGVPDARELARDVAALGSWFSDAHGAADWRRAVSGVLAEEIRRELDERTGSELTRPERTGAPEAGPK